MAITPLPGGYTLTAVNEAITLPQRMEVVGMTFQGGVSGGSALTAGQRLVVRDSATVGSGGILADYLTEGTSDNADLWAGRSPRIVSALSVDNNTVGGTWVLTVFVRV